jgi:hypothetical protein
MMSAISQPRNLIGLGCVLTLGISILSAQMSGTSAWSATNSTPHNVDRALKGDRLPLVPALKSADGEGQIGFSEHTNPVAVPELLEGCESMVSTIGNSHLATVAGRCLS